MKKVRASGVKR